MSEVSLHVPESPEDIVDAMVAAAPVGTFDVLLPGGRSIKVRYPTRYSEIRLFQSALLDFWEIWSDPANVLEDLRPFAPQDWDEAYAAFLLHYWAAPENPFSQRTALRLNANPWVMNSIRKQIETAQKTLVDVAAVDEIEAAKKGSTETPSSEIASESAATPSTSTPTI